MGLNFIKANLREIRNTETGEVERVTLMSIESDMAGYRNIDPSASVGTQVFELPYILHALASAGLKPTEQPMGFPYSFPITF